MKAIDLFSGCGGMSQGFINAGIEVVAAYDNWKPAIDVYKDNFNHAIHNIDLSSVTDFEPFTKYGPDIIIGGPPCQDFSSAGKRDESLGRADLTISFAQIICAVGPRWFVMENVERITKSKILKTVMDTFHNCGYTLSTSVLDASLCGVPQARKRFFMVGCKDKVSTNFLKPFLDENLSSQPMTVHDYLGDSLNTEFYYRHPRTYQRRAIFSVHEPSPTIRGVNRPIPPNYQFHAIDACKDLAKVRPLTTIERSYIQTFPATFNFSSAKNGNLEQLIGNAVPVKLAEYLAKALLKYMNQREECKIEYQINLF